MKNFVKALGKTESAGFQYLVEKFPKISAAKLKEGVFVGPQIRVLKDHGVTYFRRKRSVESVSMGL